MGEGGEKVHTRKLKSPNIKPIAVPAAVPRITAVKITGTCERVATIGTKDGSEPRGVKLTIASIARRSEN